MRPLGKMEDHIRETQQNLSLTYAKTCREEHVTWLTAQKKNCHTKVSQHARIAIFHNWITITIKTTVSTSVAAFDPVALYITATQGCPLGSASSSSTFPRLDMSVTVAIQPVT